jgi:hypothetical protein
MTGFRRRKNERRKLAQDKQKAENMRLKNELKAKKKEVREGL